MLTYGTSHYGLKDRAQLKAGETLLVMGAAGGVGLAAVELGKAMGAVSLPPPQRKTSSMSVSSMVPMTHSLYRARLTATSKKPFPMRLRPAGSARM